MGAYTIGSIARRAGVGVETIRFYERQGLIAQPARTGAGYRQYPDGTVEQVRFIQRAKELGFSLAETRELLDLRGRHGAEREDVRARAEAKIADIDEKVRDLQRMRASLVELTRACARRGPAGNCPILEALVGEVAA